MRVVDAVGLLAGSPVGGVVMLGAEGAVAAATAALALAEIPCVSLTNALLDRIEQPEALADREVAACHGDAGGTARVALEAARQDVRTALAAAYDRLLADLAAVPRLVVRDLELALAERLDPERLATGRETMAWLLPGTRVGGRTRLFHQVSPPAWLDRCDHLWELADESR